MENNSKETYLVVDADSLIYSSVTCSKEEDHECYVRDIGVAIANLDEKIQGIINTIWEDSNINITSMCLIVGGEDNFRKILFPSYKANRPPSPPLRTFLSSYVESNYNGFKSHGAEADDVIYATHEKLKAEGNNVIIAALDKDLKQIPNCYFFDYYYQRMNLEFIDAKTARYNFFSQLLIGDAGDAIVGIKGYGKAKPPVIFKGCVSEFSYLRATYVEYAKKYKSKARQKLVETYTLVKLQKNVSTPTDLNFIEI